jgi:hypothetical protein
VQQGVSPQRCAGRRQRGCAAARIARHDPFSRNECENKATVEISNGNATAVASCLNVLNDAANATQTNICKNNAVAKGGDVKLEDVDISVIQG